MAFNVNFSFSKIDSIKLYFHAAKELAREGIHHLHIHQVALGALEQLVQHQKIIVSGVTRWVFIYVLASHDATLRADLSAMCFLMDEGLI